MTPMAKKIKTHKKHRVCRIRGCEQILSIYNADTYCHAHQITNASQAPMLANARN